MTQKEFTSIIALFKERLEEAEKIKKNTSTMSTKQYLQGGIDTLTSIIESFEKRYNDLLLLKKLEKEKKKLNQ